MALLHNVKKDFKVDLDFEERERVLKQAMMIDTYKKSSRRYGIAAITTLDTEVIDMKEAIQKIQEHQEVVKKLD